MAETEQDKTEEATPFKLRKAREKGQIAKGTDIAFFGTLAALTLYVLFSGPAAISQFIARIKELYLKSISSASGGSQEAVVAIRDTFAPGFMIVAGLGALVFTFVILLQIIQMKGLLFTAHPLKPDFNRVNPAKGLKRLFSFRMLKEALKNIIKMVVYCTTAFLICWPSIQALVPTLVDAEFLIAAMTLIGTRLLLLFAFLAMIFAAIDQVIVRQEFRKQMRMSKSEVKREHKDREGEPRIKQKRKQLHKEFTKQTNDLGNLPGSDLLIVNPTHYAVGLRYEPDKMETPELTTKGRNRYAAILRQRAVTLGIPIIQNPPLARALYKHGTTGHAIPEKTFREVAKAYIFLRTQ
ncbi:EscU/YscU/HrcU family type III secretion system export apparatus switch protein [Ponticaulis sp.]|uniref:EscU/YscU/HrcU family type III secretion system export apparatus switch protein n=1 Tax=Ponticaulis sp. TaxID=2020902 RepID=UPI000B7077E0|nr:EscU/YscU/HrcU family type III secretion system export apparatus switch protein [Ponticaulis sp.]MAJ07455.1 flagellar biosynthesis protein FlhB [Ponticaulis sp.]RPG17690.1 MAG: EscU/YscU/HrcU family type III secretion system export apparatus switch protein [Hyphomonadaceae bacterium TMED125]|tara:strand:+ start:5773 stop:6828 length:1056 start_codon:yes stop_codon:yes gene_type:complete